MEEYNNLREQVIKELEKLKSERDDFPKKQWVQPIEDELDSKFGDLEKKLRENSYKYAMRTLMHIRDGLVYNYWSEIKDEAWDLMIDGMNKLKDPEKIIRQDYREFSAQLLSLGVHPLPNTLKIEERYGTPDEIREKHSL